MIRLFLLCCCLLLSSCKEGGAQTPANALSVGVISGPDSKILQVVQNVALEKYELPIKIVEFQRYAELNPALANREIDVNIFQHQPYLIAWNAEHHGNLIPIAKTFVYPMGIYSYKYNWLKEISKNDVIAIPIDPTNQARALVLMQAAGLIRLKEGADVLATSADIISNPLNLKIRKERASLLPSILSEVDAAVINNAFAINAGLEPYVKNDLTTYTDALYTENVSSLYANVIVIRPDEVNDPRIQLLVRAFQSPQVLAAAQTIYRGSAVKAWQK
jgi:D-methionine transport system substrate-binding protein